MKNRVVITGIGMVSPLGLDRQSTWNSLVAGKSGVAPIASFDAENYKTTIAAEVKGFDPDGILGRKEARRMDRFVQLAATAALEAVKHAGLTINADNTERVSVMIASGIGGIITLSQQVGVLHERGPSRHQPILGANDAARYGIWPSFDYARRKRTKLLHRIRMLQRSRLHRTSPRSIAGRRRRCCPCRRLRGSNLPHWRRRLQRLPSAFHPQQRPYRRLTTIRRRTGRLRYRRGRRCPHYGDLAECD